MLIVSFILAILIEIFFPIALAFWVTRHYKTNWLLIGIGALTFVLSQVVHLPLLGALTALFSTKAIPFPGGTTGIILNALILGFLAGICEEPARWIGYKILKEKGNSFEAAVTLGVGHGGFESVGLIGFSVLANLIIMILITRFGVNIPGITPEQAAQFWSMPWHLPLAGAVERLITLVLHISLSTLVWLAIAKKNNLWLGAAILWHMIVDSSIVTLSSFGMSPWAIEGIYVFFGLGSILIIRMASKAKIIQNQIIEQ